MTPGSEYDAVVYDLDGTLVRLAVDWDRVAAEAASVYERHDVAVPGRNLWELLESAAQHDLRGEVEGVINEYERDGARRSQRLDHADELLDRSVPVGVCSLNCEAACRIALETHDVLHAVDAVVGRDTVETSKPDPEPLLRVVDELSAAPEDALFVGDTRRDERTARRAGTDFTYVGDGPATYD